MERQQLESFLAVAEAGSFTRASSRLSIAQPCRRRGPLR
jgi:DNA-binding transcriptional LysR family regulator